MIAPKMENKITLIADILLVRRVGFAEVDGWSVGERNISPG
jgi:hypothetical protein